MTDALSHQICTVFFFLSAWAWAPPCGHNTLLILQLPNGQKRTHVPSGILISLGMFPLLSTSNLLDTLPASLKTQKKKDVQTDSHFHSQFFLSFIV